MTRKPDRPWSLGAALALMAVFGSCGWRELQHDQLFGSDGGMPDADGGDPGDADGAAGLDEGLDVVAVDLPVDLPEDLPADLAVDFAPEVAPDLPDAQPDLTTIDSGPAVDTVAACTPTSCPAEQFCDDLTQLCQPKQGVGMVSGVVYSSCDHKWVPTRIGIAGQHQCVVDQKGSYYFRTGLPLGLLTLSAYAAGYKVFSIAVDVKATGTVQDIALVPDTPNGCSDPAPTPVACTCTIPGCPGVP